MSNILFLIPKYFEFRLLSLLNESSFKIEKIFYEKKPTELPETPKFDLIIFALVKEVDWLSIT